MPRSARPQSPETLEVVHPIWLLKAIGLTLVGALVCGYITLCLLFYQGQWQLVLHPELTAAPLNTLAGLPAIPVRFDATESGLPRLSGVLLPAAAPSRLSAYTVLYLRGGNGSLAHDSSDAARLAVLHSLGLNLLAFDYRGFGASDPTRPNQRRMSEDAAAAFRFLRESRATPPDHILLYGSGLGASLAATLAAANPTIPAVILDAPGPPPLTLALADPRTRALPVRALFHENFPLDGLAHLPAPKLLIRYIESNAPEPYTSAADPKTTLALAVGDTTHLTEALSRFLDQYLAASPGP